MTAVDAFRKAMTGGNRVVDSTGNTILLGARQTLSPGHSWFPIKRLDNAQDSTPYTGTIYIIRYANGFAVCSNPNCTVGETGSGENTWPTVSGPGAIEAFRLQVEVCDPKKGLEANCNPANNKPEGVIQKYADKMRFGLISYAMKNNPDITRDGGVIRANMKWITHTIPYGMKYHDANGDLVVCNNKDGCPNPEREINPDGTFITNPDNVPGASYSGVINYINKFGYKDGYKEYDPISEMYYEIIRYFKNLGPSTDNYCTGLDPVDDGAPVYCGSSSRLSWRDPYIYPCQKSFVVAINDANPWRDKRIPGTRFTYNYDNNNDPDYGVPSNADNSINVSYWTDLVGNIEGITPGYMCIGCVLGGPCDWQATPKYVSQLSRAAGTCPWPPKKNSYYIAGLSYYAYQTDLRADLDGNQNIKTYMIDTQESNPNMLVGRYNMLYLAAKFGGFDDINNNGRPDLPAEWDKDGDGLPDNYFFASDPTKIEDGLNKAFSDIIKEASSGATVATLSSRYQSSALILQPAFYPEFQGASKKLQWIGILRGYWVDTFGKFREDTVQDKILQIFGQAIDRVFSFFFGANNEPKVALFNGDPDEDPNVCSSAQIIDRDIHRRLNPVLDFDCRLAQMNSNERNIKYITDGNALQDFTPSQSSSIKSLWETAWEKSGLQADSIIRYLRGEDSGYNYDYEYTSRNNKIDLQSICPSPYSGERVWKLGSIVYSTPVIAGNKPLITKYIYAYNDDTYRNYIRANEYKNRISMAFVGTNQGLLHGFRVGYLRNTGNSLTPAELTNGPNDGGKDRVGREEFALIPRNALPYMLQYGNQGACGAGAYIPILDYRLDVFDASFWSGYSPTGQKTQNSWRTYLLVPMGLGGKAIYDSNNNLVASSSVLLLDITNHLLNPSTPPQLVWEFRLPDNTLTTAYPARVRIGDGNQNGYWYIVMGSGPKDPYADSYGKFVKPKLYIIDPSKPNNLLIKDIDLSPLVQNDVNAAVGDIRVFDLDDDYQDDVIYFGMYGYKSDGSLWGGLFRMVLKVTNDKKLDVENLSVSKVLDLDSFAENGNTPPVFAGVSAVIDDNGDLWIYVNTGLFLSTNHRNIPYSNYLIGFKDPCWDRNTKGFNTSCSATVSKGDLVDSKILSNYTDRLSGQQCTDDYLKFTQYRTQKQCICTQNGCSQQDIVISTNALVDNCTLGDKKGWYYKLPNGGIAYTKPITIAGVVLSSYFEPVNDPCQAGGKTYALALNYKTGLPFSNPPLVIVGNADMQNKLLNYQMFLAYGAPPLGEMFRFIPTSSGIEVVWQTSGSGVGRAPLNIRTIRKFVLWIEK
ncbi:MAG: pilus assembly protein [Aquificaceae bacterium]